MDKQEGLKELRNKILRIFGESLDEYIREKEEFAKSIAVLSGMKAQLLSEISELKSQKSKLMSESTKLTEDNQAVGRETDAKRKETQRAVLESYSKLNEITVERRNALDIREKKLDEADNLIKERQDKLIKDEEVLKAQLDLPRRIQD